MEVWMMVMFNESSLGMVWGGSAYVPNSIEAERQSNVKEKCMVWKELAQDKAERRKLSDEKRK